MTYREYTEKLLKEYGIDYEIEKDEFDKDFPCDDLFKGYKGTRHGIEWHLSETCSWDNYCQLIYGNYRANRISIKTAIKKILAFRQDEGKEKEMNNKETLNLVEQKEEALKKYKAAKAMLTLKDATTFPCTPAWLDFCEAKKVCKMLGVKI